MRCAMRRAMRRDETFHVWTTGSRTDSRSAAEVYRSPDCPSIDDRTKLHFLSSGTSASLLTDVQLILQPLSFRNQLDKTNTLSPYTDGNGNDKMWYPDMAICQTIGQTMTTSLAGKRHRIGLLISPPPWVGKTPKVGVEEDGTEFITYPPGHVSLFFIVAAPPGKFGKTLAIWDSDAEGEIRHKAEERQIQKPLRVREGFTGIQYHLYDFLSKKANLAGTYIGGSGNEGKADCGALAIDTLLSWVRGEQGELTAACLEQMGFRRLAK